MKKTLYILSIIQFGIGLLILIGHFSYLIDDCKCAPPMGLGMAVTDLLFPVLWIFSLVIIFLSIKNKLINFIFLVISVSVVVHLGWNLLAYKLDQQKLTAAYNQEEIVTYISPNQQVYNGPDIVVLTLYSDHYEVIKHIGEECGCFYIGTYKKSNDTIYFDENIVQENMNINTKIFIELTDTTICPVNSDETIFFKSNKL